MQIGFLSPGLGMTHRHSFWTTLVVAVGCVVYDYILAGFVPMPIPFQLVTAIPVFMTIFSIVFALLYGQKLKNSTALRKSTIRAMNVISVQLSLTFVYPIFIYGFNSIATKYQTRYMIILPIIKITAKNIMSRFVDSNDMKPEILVFCIDAFHAVYVTVAMQNATTTSTLLLIMLIDIAQICVSVYDVYQEFQPLKGFMDKIPIDHPLHGKNLLMVAIALDQRGIRTTKRDLGGLENDVDKIDDADILHETVLSTSLKYDTGSRKVDHVKVVPIVPRCELVNHESPTAEELHDLGSDEDRECFVLCARKLLFTTEFVTLAEYSEVIMPAFYSKCSFFFFSDIACMKLLKTYASCPGLFVTAIYHLPNRAFYSIVVGVDEHELWINVTSMLLYAVLELMSLLAIDFALRRITGISPMRQVGFVLETQFAMVQSKLFSWVFYALQISLEHLGADFSFQFKWLH